MFFFVYIQAFKFCIRVHNIGIWIDVRSNSKKVEHKREIERVRKSIKMMCGTEYYSIQHAINEFSYMLFKRTN